MKWRRSDIRGFTLVEVLIASAIAATVLGVTAHMALQGLGVNNRCLTQGSVQEQVRRAMEMLVRELKDSGEGCSGWAVGVNPSPSSQYYDQDVTQVSFSRCTGYDAAQDLRQWGPVVTWSLQAAQGAEPGKLVRREGGAEAVVCDRVSEVRLRYIPATAQFSVTLVVQCPDPESPTHFIRSSLTQMVTLRN